MYFNFGVLLLILSFCLLKYELRAAFMCIIAVYFLIYCIVAFKRMIINFNESKLSKAFKSFIQIFIKWLSVVIQVWCSELLMRQPYRLLSAPASTTRAALILIKPKAIFVTLLENHANHTWAIFCLGHKFRAALLSSIGLSALFPSLDWYVNDGWTPIFKCISQFYF